MCGNAREKYFGGDDERLRKGGDIHLTVAPACFVHDSFQSASGRVVNPLFATLRADGSAHAPHHHIFSIFPLENLAPSP